MLDDIRWIQRFNNYKKALKTLENDIELFKTRELSEIEKRGVIQAFEYTYELAWNVIKDFYFYNGIVDIQGSRDAFKMAFNRGLVSSDILIRSIKSRQLTTHTYNEEIIEDIFNEIINEYFDAFIELKDNLEKETLKCMD
jgi:nucleotidyltransferase substrate binding protein (TIGR01987 family)